MKNLVRTRGGRVIHRDTCRHNVTSMPWLWADAVSLKAIQSAAVALGLKACRVCRPLDARTHREAL